MRKLLILIILFSLGLFSKAEKKQVCFKNLLWQSDEKIFTSVNEFRETATSIDGINIESFILTADKSHIFHSIIELTESENYKLFIEMQDECPFATILVNGEPINNLRSDNLFLSEITISQEEELLLTLIIDKLPDNQNSLASYLDGMFLSKITDFAIAWCEPMKDPFWGSYMLEVHLHNLLANDIDGKLLARITDASTLELVVENNNCAFMRSNSEAIIDINFPDAKEKLKPGKYFVEIVLVDKEKNEEEVDKLVAPMFLN